jgi:hypothetical protein
VIVRDKATGHIVVQDPVVVELGEFGSIDIQLQVTSDPNLEPEGWQWEVTEQITSRTARRYPLLLPADTAPFDLSKVEVPPSAVFLDPQSLYLKGVQVGPTTVRNPNQPPTVDVTSKDSIATLRFQLPRAGAPAVGSVQVGTPAQGPNVTSSDTADGDPRFNFRLPRSRNVQAGTTSMVNPDQPAALSTSEDANGDLTLNLSVPRAAEVTVGTVTTFLPDQNPDVITTVTDGDVELDFGLPRAADVSLGAVTPVDNDQLPTITNSGTDGDVVLDIDLPKAKTLDLGTVTVVNPNVNPAISDSGDVNAAVFNISLPRAADITLGTVTELNPDETPDVTFVTTDGDVAVDFDLPRAAAVTVDEPATVLDPDQNPTVASTTTDGDVEIAFSLPRAPAVTVDEPATVLNPDQQPSVTSLTTDGDVEIQFSLPAAPTFAVGTVTTVGPSETADATDVGTDGNIVIDFDLPRGEKGWSPVFNLVIDGSRRVLQIDDWVGGEGAKPATGDYIGATGLVSDIALAVDVRGEQGPAGTGSIDQLSDVTITSVVNGQILIYDDAISNWVNVSPDTDDIAEGSNLYYTDARVEAVIAGSTTDDLDEGVTNLYYTDTRADDRIAAAVLGDLANTDVAAAAADDLLAFDGTDWVPTDGPTVDQLFFDTAAAVEPAAEGELAWDDDAGTIDLMMNAGVLLHVGQEMFVRVKNQTGTGFAKGDVLAYDGTVGSSGVIDAKLAVADGSEPSALILGVAAAAIADGDDGYALQQGRLTLNTTTTDWVAEDLLYADPATPGGLTRVQPAAPNLRYAVAVVVSTGASGRLYVRLTPGSSLANDELATLTSLQDGDLLVYNGTNGRFENGTLGPTDVGALPDDADLDDLNDVSVSSPSDGDILVYQSGSWVNQEPESPIGLIIALGG